MSIYNIPGGLKKKKPKSVVEVDNTSTQINHTVVESNPTSIDKPGQEPTPKKKAKHKRKWRNTWSVAAEIAHLYSTEFGLPMPLPMLQDQAKEAALKLARGHYQREIILGHVSPSNHIFKNRAASYTDTYQDSRMNLYKRLRTNKIPVFIISCCESYQFVFGELALIEILRYRKTFKGATYRDVHTAQATSWMDTIERSSDDAISPLVNMTQEAIDTVRGFYDI